MEEEFFCSQYGWNSFFEKQITKEKKYFEYGRILSVHKSKYEIVTKEGILILDSLGSLQYQKDPRRKPVVGDWVWIRNDSYGKVIHSLFDRFSLFVRKKSNWIYPKPIGANIDTIIFLLDSSNIPSFREIQKTLLHIFSSNINAVLVFNKTDLLLEKKKKSEIESLFHSVQIFWISLLNGEGLDEFQSYLQPGLTYSLIGPSGVGKSSLVNFFFQEQRMKIGELMKNRQGKHTTTFRKLLKSPQGFLFIDNPGARIFYDEINEDNTKRR